MARPASPRRVDVASMAAAGARIEGRTGQSDFARLADLTEHRGGEREVAWELRGEERQAAGRVQPWLQLSGDALLSMTCQRCLEPVDVPLSVRRWYRFVADEETAAHEDEDAQEDVLALEQRLDALELLEDEFLMDAPAVPRHEACPAGSALLQALAAPEQEKPGTYRPFAGLKTAKGDKAN